METVVSCDGADVGRTRFPGSAGLGPRLRPERSRHPERAGRQPHRCREGPQGPEEPPGHQGLVGRAAEPHRLRSPPVHGPGCLHDHARVDCPGRIPRRGAQGGDGRRVHPGGAPAAQPRQQKAARIPAARHLVLVIGLGHRGPGEGSRVHPAPARLRRLDGQLSGQPLLARAPRPRQHAPGPQRAPVLGLQLPREGRVRRAGHHRPHPAGDGAPGPAVRRPLHGHHSLLCHAQREARLQHQGARHECAGARLRHDPGPVPSAEGGRAAERAPERCGQPRGHPRVPAQQPTLHAGRPGAVQGEGHHAVAVLQHHVPLHRLQLPAAKLDAAADAAGAHAGRGLRENADALRPADPQQDVPALRLRHGPEHVALRLCPPARLQPQQRARAREPALQRQRLGGRARRRAQPVQHAAEPDGPLPGQAARVQPRRLPVGRGRPLARVRHSDRDPRVTSGAQPRPAIALVAAARCCRRCLVIPLLPVAAPTVDLPCRRKGAALPPLPAGVGDVAIVL